MGKAMRRANGTGTVYKLAGRRRRPWVAAKQKIIIGYYPTKKDAIAALERLAGKDLTERYNMTFAQVFDAWKVEHYKKIGPIGIEGYDGAFKIFAPLHDRKFRELKTADFQGVLDAHMHKSHSTVSKYKQILTQMSTWAMREEIITTNFAKFVQLPENTKKEKETFTDAEISKLEADGSDTAKIILMLIYTGMRIGELFTLPTKDYHKDYVIGGEKTEAGRNRIIPIRPEGLPYFAYFANKATGPLLISGYARVVHQQRHRAECLLHAAHHCVHLRAVGHVRLHRHRPAALALELAHQLLGTVLPHAVVHAHGPALPGQLRRHGPSDSARRPRHQRDLFHQNHLLKQLFPPV